MSSDDSVLSKSQQKNQAAEEHNKRYESDRELADGGYINEVDYQTVKLYKNLIGNIMLGNITTTHREGESIDDKTLSLTIHVHGDMEMLEEDEFEACNGSYLLNSACGRCAKCLKEMEVRMKERSRISLDTKISG